MTLAGVPGIGKSRLVAELFRTVDEDVAFVRWRQGRSLPYGEGVTFWALAEIVKAEAGILESDTPELSDEKLRHSVDRVVGDERSVLVYWFKRVLRGAPARRRPERARSTAHVSSSCQPI